MGATLSWQGFVVDSANGGAVAALERVFVNLAQDGPQPDTNPLVLHGPAGVGKTHLSRALLAAASAYLPTKRCRLIRAEELGTLSEMQPFAEQDLLIVEDLQLALKRPRLEQCLVELLDWAARRGCQLVVTSSLPPQHLAGASRRLESRLRQGLVVSLTYLESEGRFQFLRQRAEQEQLPVPSEVLNWLLQRGPASGRHLEGMIRRLLALSRQQGTLTLRLVMTHWESPGGDAVRLRQLTGRVAKHFQVPVRSLRSPQRTHALQLARNVGMYLSRERTRLPLQRIGRFFGRRDHTTVLQACRRVRQAVAHQPALAQAVRDLAAAEI